MDSPKVAVPSPPAFEHVACRYCQRDVVIRHEHDPQAAKLWTQPWSCPYRDCRKLNYAGLAGVITDVARGDSPSRSS